MRKNIFRAKSILAVSQLTRVLLNVSLAIFIFNIPVIGLANQEELDNLRHVVDDGNISPRVRENVMRLYSIDVVDRAWGIHNLGEMGNKAELATPFLIAVLDDQHEVVHRIGQVGISSQGPISSYAIQALLSIGKPAVPYLINSLKKYTANSRYSIRSKNSSIPENPIRENIILALGLMKEKSCTELLIEGLKDKSDKIRERSAQALGQIGEPRALPALITALQDERNSVNSAAAMSLEKLHWKPTSIHDRINFLIAVGKWNDLVAIGSESVPSLIEFLEANEIWFRTVDAIKALAEIGDTRALGPLRNARRNNLLREHADKAIEKIQNSK